MMFNFDNLDFTFHKFRQLCSAVSIDYPTLTMAEYLSGLELPEMFVIMRHDIDRKPWSALPAARFEQDLGINAAYYFRTNVNVLRHEIMREIEEVGYELKECWKTCEIKMICMHGSSLSKYKDNSGRYS